MVHHSELLHRAGIDGDRAVWLDPEFDVRERIVHVGDIPLVSALGKSDYADVFLGQRALSRLERYLRERFGTPEALVEFAKDYWDVAKWQLEPLVIPSSAVTQTELVAEYVADPGETLIIGADWLRDSSYTLLKVQIYFHRPWFFSPETRDDYLVRLLRGERLVAELRHVLFQWGSGLRCLDVTGEIFRELGPLVGVGVDRMLVYHVVGPGDYHAWRDLFLDKRYRVRAWNEPFDFDRAIGLTEVAA